MLKDQKVLRMLAEFGKEKTADWLLKVRAEYGRLQNQSLSRMIEKEKNADSL